MVGVYLPIQVKKFERRATKQLALSHDLDTVSKIGSFSNRRTRSADESFKVWERSPRCGWPSSAGVGLSGRKRMNVHGALKRVAALAIASVLSASAAYAADKVTFVTDFGYLGRHAYYFVALDKGYYRDAGLEVDIVRGQGSADVVKQVGAGTAQMGFADAASVILGRANDGVPVKTVAEIYAKPPHAIFTLEGSGITKPKDLEGRTIADSASSSLPKLFPAYAKAAGIDASKVKWLFVNSDAIAATLALGRADAVTYYIISRKLMEKAVAPKKLFIMKFTDVGMDFYSNGLIANDKILKTNPDLVRRFVKATLHGLKDAIDDPEGAAKIINKYQRQIDVDVAKAEMQVVAMLVQTPPEPLGFVDRGRMQRTIDLVKNSFDLKNPVTVDDVFADGFVPK